MFGLESLPYELLSNIVANISFDDVLNLAWSCKKLNFLIEEESISKSILQSKKPFSNEAQQAVKAGRGCSRALRRCAKRRHALRTGRPFAISTIGFCDAYIYCKGVLCYTLDDTVRILNLHNSDRDELVISIPALIRHALSGIHDHSRGAFQVLYYSDSIIACLYRTFDPDPSAWLIAFDVNHKTLLAVKELESINKIFVRHDNQHLYYGTHSEIGSDGYKRWVLHGYQFSKRKWFDRKVHFPELVGSDIGFTVCFEIYNGYIYALSNQTSFEIEEIDWTSFYHCFRFPLESPCNELVEKTSKEDDTMWRRQHEEGPIDDRWTTLRLYVDEESGKLRIAETRKEWPLGSSRSQRIHYMADVVFPERFQEGEGDDASDYWESGHVLNDDQEDFSNADESPQAILNALSTRSLMTSSSRAEGCHNLQMLPEGPLKYLLHPEDNPRYIFPPQRLPQNKHPENNDPTRTPMTVAQSKLRTYHASCGTFMDLVDSPLPADWQSKQRLRLRVGCRNIAPPLVHAQGPKKGILREPNEDLAIALDEMYRYSDITYWPPDQDPENPDEDLNAIYRLLNPSSHLGNVSGTVDDRGLVYVTGRGGSDGPQAIIYLSFDPSTKLVGLKTWGGLNKHGVGEEMHVQGRAKGSMGGSDVGIGKMEAVDVYKQDRAVPTDRKGKGRQITSAPVQVAAGNSWIEAQEGSNVTLGREWDGPNIVNTLAWKEPAMHRTIGLGFSFGLPRAEKDY